MSLQKARETVCFMGRPCIKLIRECEPNISQHETYLLQKSNASSSFVPEQDCPPSGWWRAACPWATGCTGCTSCRQLGSPPLLPTVCSACLCSWLHVNPVSTPGSMCSPAPLPLARHRAQIPFLAPPLPLCPDPGSGAESRKLRKR